MKNPFEDLGVPRLEKPQGELVEGAFSCQEKGCYTNPVGEARYLREAQILTWICKDNHINRIEEFKING